MNPLPLVCECTLIFAYSEESIKVINDSPSSSISKDSVDKYAQLQKLVRLVEQMYRSSRVGDTGEGLKLTSFLSELVSKTWHGIKDILSS